MRPRIGIALASPTPGHADADARREHLDVAYARAVVEAGGVPLGLLRPGTPAEALDAVDALVVPGGDDLLPPGTPRDAPGFRPTAPERLAFDRALLELAWARALPVLGICYGMQLLASVRGGSLVYDLARDRAGAGEHRLTDPAVRHGVTLLPGSALARALGAVRIRVNSRHHQAVAEPGAGLRIVGRADDGVVEAIEAEGVRLVLGVQWHPEGLEPAHRKAVFGALVEAARVRRLAADRGTAPAGAPIR